MSKKYYIIIICFILLALGWVFLNYIGQQEMENLEPANLALALPENQSTEPWEKIITDFQIKYPHISVKISNNLSEAKITSSAYKNPDIMLLNSDEFLDWQNRIQPVSQDIISLKDFKDEFVPGTYDLIQQDQILGLPIFMDILVLYFNPDLVENPPKTWIEFNDIVKKITKIDANGKIIISGAGLGTGDNIEYVQDILTMLMFQQGTPWPDFSKSIELNGELYYPGERVLEFYTSYANSNRSVYSWNKSLGNNFNAFKNNKVGMVFGFASDRENLMNVHIAPVPQITGTDQDINYGKYSFLAVSADSLHAKQAQEFIHFASSKEHAKILFSSLKELTSRKDLAAWQSQDPDIGSIAPQVLSSQTWPKKNSGSIKAVFAEMIEAYLGGRRDLADAVEYGAEAVESLK